MANADAMQQLIEALHAAARAFNEVANQLSDKKSLEAEEATSAAEEKEPEKKLTLEDVRKTAADKSRQGHTEEVRKLIQKFGASKLSEVDEEKYPALMKDLEAIGHAK
jgi:hypothetical protein